MRWMKGGDLAGRLATLWRSYWVVTSVRRFTMNKIAVLSLALVAVALALLLFNAGAPATAANSPVSPPQKPTHVTIVSHGRWAVVSWEDGSTWGWVYVTEEQFGRQTRTWMDYSIYKPCDWPCESCVEAGWGYIPNDGFGQPFKLNTDTSAIPDYKISCGTGGVITVDWTPIKEISYRSTGTYEERLIDYRHKVIGTYEWSSASVQGNVVGSPITGVIWDAGAGKSQGVTVDISREP
jgi:hypothetical protein